LYLLYRVGHQQKQKVNDMITGLLLLAVLNCYSFDDADKRAYCLALEQKNIGSCYSISDAGLRAQCRAELSGDRSVCDGISDHDKRQECKMRSGERS
jgi:hypothetical protein